MTSAIPRKGYPEWERWRVGMVYAPSSGALWLDVTVTGLGFLTLPILGGIVLLTHPGVGLAPAVTTVVLWFAFIGACIVGMGLLVGKRTHWKVPDPKVPKVG
jgi:hypothetical protein